MDSNNVPLLSVLVIEDDPGDALLGIDLGGFRMVAEGVEELTQLDFLREHGCSRFQGFYFSRPLPPAEFAAYCHTAKA